MPFLMRKRLASKIDEILESTRESHHKKVNPFDVNKLDPAVFLRLGTAVRFYKDTGHDTPPELIDVEHITSSFPARVAFVLKGVKVDPTDQFISPMLSVVQVFVKMSLLGSTDYKVPTECILTNPLDDEDVDE